MLVARAVSRSTRLLISANDMVTGLRFWVESSLASDMAPCLGLGPSGVLAHLGRSARRAPNKAKYNRFHRNGQLT
jgi:hypothetical protein